VSDSPYASRSVTRVLDIMDYLRRHPKGATPAELATATDMPRSSVFRYLTTLEARGYAERDTSTGSFHLGPAFLASDVQHLRLLSQRARPILEELRDRFEETVNLGVLDGSRVVYLEIVESRRSMRFVARKGDHEPIHSTGLGKAISMLLDDGTIRGILDSEGMPARTSRTITDPDEFLASIHASRQAGYAIDDGENEADGRCVAVPIPGLPFPAALSLSAPATRFSEREAKAAFDVLAEAVRRIAGEET
jgi:IclR family transcriptional regulator, acetate operon repressor